LVKERVIYLLISMHIDEGNSGKSLCIGSYITSMDFVDISDMMATSLYISQKTWEVSVGFLT
jgi:hypothetical protein